MRHTSGAKRLVSDYQRYEQTRSYRKEAAPSSRPQTLYEAGIPLRAGVRDHGSHLLEECHSGDLHTGGEVFLTGDQAAGSRQPQLDRVGCEIVADCLRAGREVRLRVAGSSMLPAIRPHDTLVIRAAGDSQPSIGKIILYAGSGCLIAHRVVRRLDAGIARFETRGDALPACDAPVVQAEILGFVIAIVRGNRELPVRAGKSAGLLSLALRNSDLLCRIALKVHAMRLRLAGLRSLPGGRAAA